MSRTRTPRQWREILDAFDRSELSQAEFCRRRGVALATFRYHRARVTARDVAWEVAEAPRLVELFSEPGPRTSESLRLELDLDVGPVTVHGHAALIAELLSRLASSRTPTRP